MGNGKSPLPLSHAGWTTGFCKRLFQELWDKDSIRHIRDESGRGLPALQDAVAPRHAPSASRSYSAVVTELDPRDGVELRHAPIFGAVLRNRGLPDQSPAMQERSIAHFRARSQSLIGNARVPETPFRKAWLAAKPLRVYRTPLPVPTVPESEIRRQARSQSGDWERASHSARTPSVGRKQIGSTWLEGGKRNRPNGCAPSTNWRGLGGEVHCFENRSDSLIPGTAKRPCRGEGNCRLDGKTR